MSVITIYGGGLSTDSYESSTSLVLRTPRNIPDFTESVTIYIPGHVT